MGLFKRKKDEAIKTCPQCCQIVSPEATECDLCGADLTETKPEAASPSPTATAG
jgi:hypothetical protein